MKLSLCSVEYKTHTKRDALGKPLYRYPVVYLFCRDSNFRRVVVKDESFRPYGFIEYRLREKDFKEILENPEFEKCILKLEKHPILAKEGELLKIVCDIPYNWKKLRTELEKKGINTFEGDVLFTLRYMIDKNIKSGIEYDKDTKEIKPVDMPSRLKVLFVDIEVFSQEIPDVDKALAPVIVVGFYNSYSKEYVLYYYKKKSSINIPLHKYLRGNHRNVRTIKCTSERILLSKTIDYIVKEQPDIICSFTNFDLVYLISRMRNLGLNPNKMSPLGIVKLWENTEPKISGIQIIDLAFAYMTVLGTPKWQTLDSIAKRELGYGRIFHDIPVYSIWNTKDWWKVIVRNLIDVELIVQINEIDGLIEYFDTIRKIVGCNFRDAFFPSRIADICYLRYCHDKEVLPTKSPRRKVPYTGAVVKEVIPGIYNNICVIDWNEMYPSIIKTFNISFDTWSPYSGDIVIDEEHRFVSKPKGWAPSIIEWLTPILAKNKQELNKAIERKDWKLVKRLERERLGIKSVVHGVYGFFGFAGDYEHRLPAARLYHPYVAESITYIGRTLQKEGLFPLAKRLGYKVVYGDTDSIFIQLKTDNTVEESNRLKDILSEEMEKFVVKRWKVTKPQLKLGVDKIFSRLILISKKRYAGKTIEGDKKLKGLEAIRTDTAEITVEVQNKLIDLILDDKPIGDIKNYLVGVIETFRGRPLTEIAIPVKLSKQAGEYRTFSIELQAFLVANKFLNLNLKEGERFYLVYLSKVPKEMSTIKANIVVSKRKKEKETEVREMKVKVTGFRSPKDIPKDFTVDYDRMFKLTVTDKIKEFLKLLGIEEWYNYTVWRKQNPNITVLSDFY